MRTKLLMFSRNPVRIARGAKDPRIALGQTAFGRYPRVVYVPDPEPDSVFIITAWELTGRPLAAYRNRRKKKHQ
jgi:hypothetical protein